MKKTLLTPFPLIIIICVLTLTSFKSHAQWPMYDTNFENNDSFITYSPLVSNVWQVGSTVKPFFGSAMSLPNAIMTDTMNPYPVNSSSSFVIRIYDPSGGLHNPGVPGDMWLYFTHKYQTTSGHDGGAIEVSYDSINWQNILLDTMYINNGVGGPPCCSYYNVTDTLFNGQPGFSGESNGWVYCNVQWQWFFAVRTTGWPPVPDSMWIRFTFYSDSISENMDGWMIDDISLSGINPSGIHELSDLNNAIHIFPNPATNQFTITSSDFAIKEISIFNVLGERVYTEQLNTKYKTLNTKLPAGIYFVQVATKDFVSVKKLVIE